MALEGYENRTEKRGDNNPSNNEMLQALSHIPKRRNERYRSEVNEVDFEDLKKYIKFSRVSRSSVYVEGVINERR
jgi:hypothetical protein